MQSRHGVLIGALILIVFVVIAFGIYSNTLESPFVFDDKGRIEKNQHIRITQFSLREIVKAGFNSSKSRPLAFISFALNYYFNQYDPRGYHIVNITIHVLSAYLLYLFINLTLKIPSLRPRYDHPDLIAFLAALIWLVAAKEMWALYLFSIALGLAMGSIGPSESPLVARLFGLSSHGLIYGVAAFGFTVGGAVGPVVTGYMFDVYGNYQAAFFVSAGCSLFGLVLTVLLKPTKKLGTPL